MTIRSMPILAALAWALAAPAGTSAQPAGVLPPEVEGVGVTERLDGPVPLDLPLVDEAGRPTTLGAYFRPDRPLVLVLAYYECPMLCTLVLGGLVETMREIDWVPGGEFDVVTLSIDPDETPDLARQKRETYLEAYGHPEAQDGWHFLTGPEASIHAIAQAVGFEYRYLPQQDEFAHPAVLFVLTPAGHVSRYLYGVRHDPQTFRLSLVEASAGRIGSTVDRFLLTCYRYDAATGRYTPVVMRILRIAAGLTVLALGSVLITLWLREARQKRLA